MICTHCGRDVYACRGFLKRLNPVGALPAVWECRPSCEGVVLSQDDKLLGAIEEDPRDPPPLLGRQNGG